MKKQLFVFGVCFVLSGCALPMPIQIAMWAADGVSLLKTEKSLSDHGLSAVTGKDCAVWRVVPEGRICSDVAVEGLIAEAETAVPEVFDEETPEPVELAELAPLGVGGSTETHLSEPMPVEVDFVTAAGGEAEARKAPPAAEPDHALRVAEKEAVPLMFVLEDVNMRSRPSGRSNVIRTLLRDQIAERVEERAGWLKVRIDGSVQEGWVDGRFLQEAG